MEPIHQDELSQKVILKDEDYQGKEIRFCLAKGQTLHRLQ